jgi:hypothetical protein
LYQILLQLGNGQDLIPITLSFIAKRLHSLHCEAFVTTIDGQAKAKAKATIIHLGVHHPRGKMVSILWARVLIRFTISSWNLTWYQKD